MRRRSTGGRMLQKQAIDVTLARGLDQSADEKLTQGSLLLENALFSKTGQLQKRYGWEEYPTSIRNIHTDPVFTDESGTVSDYPATWTRRTSGTSTDILDMA